MHYCVEKPCIWSLFTFEPCWWAVEILVIFGALVYAANELYHCRNKSMMCWVLSSRATIDRNPRKLLKKARKALPNNLYAQGRCTWHLVYIHTKNSSFMKLHKNINNQFIIIITTPKLFSCCIQQYHQQIMGN